MTVADLLLKPPRMNIAASLKAKARQAAFSLSESIFGVAVIGIVFVSLYSGMATGFHSIRDSQENLRATQILLEKFETLRLYNWEQLNTPGFVPPTFTTTYAPTEGSQGITYNGRVMIGQPMITDAYAPDLRMVTIILTWQSLGNGTKLNHTRTFTSFVAKYGIQNYIY
jgi:type II secretory pathway pseudopilin PulG